MSSEISDDKRQVLLISATNRAAWVLPKGGWELDEATIQDAACREAWEEAGIVVAIEKDLGHIDDNRTDDQLTSHAPRATYHFFEARVEKMEKEWPEMEKRNRQWMDYTQACEALKKRPELLDALKRCSMIR